MLVARDQKNDLALLRVANPPSAVAAFRDGAPVRAGDTVVALGYPLPTLLSSSATLTVGYVSALSGMEDDARYLQISAPVQPGNSGGPLLDASGHLAGIVTSKLNAENVARFIGDIPQNVNFAIKAEVVRTFLDSKGIAYKSAAFGPAAFAGRHRRRRAAVHGLCRVPARRRARRRRSNRSKPGPAPAEWRRESPRCDGAAAAVVRSR